ncbi:MAG: dienelactone hydrolase family protein, partial [Chloroflexota bacterium]|nr:dienelactone hydrolase family protein [Chloroflexota bacterium]
MCFELDARPPLPPIRGGASDARGLLLTSGDGTRLSAYAARATEPAAPGPAAPGSGAPGIVVIPDIRGLHPYYEELALRFAEAGVNAVAIDLYARTAGTGSRDEDFDAQSHAAQARPDAVSADVAAAVGYLRGRQGGSAARVYTVGFCFGGRI